MPFNIQAAVLPLNIHATVFHLIVTDVCFTLFMECLISIVLHCGMCANSAFNFFCVFFTFCVYRVQPDIVFIPNENEDCCVCCSQFLIAA